MAPLFTSGNRVSNCAGFRKNATDTFPDLGSEPRRGEIHATYESNFLLNAKSCILQQLMRETSARSVAGFAEFLLPPKSTVCLQKFLLILSSRVRGAVRFEHFRPDNSWFHPQRHPPFSRAIRPHHDSQPV